MIYIYALIVALILTVFLKFFYVKKNNRQLLKGIEYKNIEMVTDALKTGADSDTLYNRWTKVSVLHKAVNDGSRGNSRNFN